MRCMQNIMRCLLPVLHGTLLVVPLAGVSQETEADAKITFNQHIAPLLYAHCAPCHREGMSAPFPLIRYEDARKRGRQIAEVCADRYMPPWLPEAGHPAFEGERRLTEAQISTIQAWFQQGSQEGAEHPLPPPPSWKEDWQLGEPDMVLTMPGDFQLKAEGRDVYRNFVLKVPVEKTRYIRQLEFRPLNPRVVHHALIYVDPTRQSARRDKADPEPGWSGMRVPTTASMPEGQFLSWQPGKIYAHSDRDIPWAIQPGTDLVLQIHMNPTGKEERFRCEVGLYFAEGPPEQIPFKLKLTSLAIDIPPGKEAYRVTDSLVLPTDVRLTRVLPHAHYLCRRMEGYAELPDGTRRTLILIKDWDFDWQGDYVYVEPIPLPKGTRLVMDYTYDNSADNPANPSVPPERVTYGPQSSDEMAELWFQFLVERKADVSLLTDMVRKHNGEIMIEFGESALSRETRDPDLLMIVAQSRMAAGNTHGALLAYQRLLQQEPNRINAWFNLGVILRRDGNLEAAKKAFANVIGLDPNESDAYGSLGLIFLQEGDLVRAEKLFAAALKLNPKDQYAVRALQEIEKAKQQAPLQGPIKP